MGPALFCMPLIPVLKNRIREEFEPRGVVAFVYLNDISIGISEITPDTEGRALSPARAVRNSYCHEPQ